MKNRSNVKALSGGEKRFMEIMRHFMLVAGHCIISNACGC